VAGWSGEPVQRRGSHSREDRRSRRERPKRRHRLRWAMTTLLALLVLAGSGGFYVYHQLNGNLTQVALSTGDTKSTGVEKADAFGHKPINILIIGTDSRSTKANCKLGGDCSAGSTGQNADVEMVAHVSADRSNITVMSVPRDTMADLPACTDPDTKATVGARYAQINSSLEYGPACTVASVHQLTGITIDHLVMVDFAGVIAMSDSVGGVSVCVDNNVFDPYSHLKLAKGKHVLKGLSALEFVRTRHGFGDGGDLGRTYAQHAFLSAVIRSLKSKGVLLNPASVYKLAQAATKALTVDTGLGTIPKLLGLATDVNKVPTDRVTFTTMQTSPDPANANRVVVAPAAKTLFATIINDQSLTKAKAGSTTATATPTPSATADADISTLVVRIQNASGHSGRASAVAATLKARKFGKGTTIGNAAATAVTTTIHYGPGKKAQAQALATLLKLPDTALHVSTTTTGVTLFIGSDWVTGKTYPSSAAAAAERTKNALSQAHAQTATKSSCVPVSTQKTVTVNGIPMTPIQAFDASPTKKLSAK
jgi:LCP family protein required for cell wall assembly